MATVDNSWLGYPPSVRITMEEKNTSNVNILIGSDQEDPTYSRWSGTFVINRNDEFFTVAFEFRWDDVDEYPKMSPKFNFDSVEAIHLGKIKHLFDKDNRLKLWSGSTSIMDNLKQIYNSL